MRGPCKTALGDGVSSSHRCGSARVAAAIVQRPDLVKIRGQRATVSSSRRGSDLVESSWWAFPWKKLLPNIDSNILREKNDIDPRENQLPNAPFNVFISLEAYT